MTAWVTIAVLALGTIAIKAAGPLAFGRRQPSAAVSGVIVLIAPALLAALVVYETVHTGTHGLAFDARLAGVAAAAVALALRLPLVVVIAVAAAAAATVRAFS
jgi:branched-subunit amino acid transport protein AzlD